MAIFVPHYFQRGTIPLAAAALLVLSGCASFSADGGMQAVSAMTKARAGQDVRQVRTEPEQAAVGQTVTALLRQPLSADTAVQIALMNNPGLQVALAGLGSAEADLVQAGRLRNPSLSFSRMREGAATEIERSIMFDVAGLLTMPVRLGIERQRFQQMQLQAAMEAVQLAARTRKAYFEAVAAQQTLQYMEQVGEAAQAGAELAKRMAKVGNWSKLDQAREQVFYAETVAQIARARHHVAASREQLTRLLGLWGEQTGFSLPARLPDLPKEPDAHRDLESLAMQQRLDIQASKHEADMTARALGLTRATGLINVLHLGYANRSETGEPRANGYEVELELPIFDWSGAKSVKAEAIYMQTLHRTADTAVRARSEVRQAYAAYRTTYDLARHYRDEVVPLRKKISEEVLLRYNGMLVSVFELLADARDQIQSVNAAIEAQRDFWMAETDLQMAINGSGGSASVVRNQPASTAASAKH